MKNSQYALISTLSDFSGCFCVLFDTESEAQEAAFKYLRAHHPDLLDGKSDEGSALQDVTQKRADSEWFMILPVSDGVPIK